MGRFEKRRTPRLYHARRVTLMNGNGAGECAITIDLSAGGALLDVGRPEPLGRTVQIDFGEGEEVVAVVKRTAPVFGGRRHLLAVAFEEDQPEIYSEAVQREKWLESFTNFRAEYRVS